MKKIWRIYKDFIKKLFGFAVPSLIAFLFIDSWIGVFIGVVFWAVAS
jgi:hypothetical protein